MTPGGFHAFEHRWAVADAFDVEGMSSDAAVLRLREADVVATTSPYRSNHARLSPSIYNTDEEVERALRAVRALRR